MRANPAKQRLKKGLFLAFVLGAGLGLAACSDIDDMFADDSDTDTAVAIDTSAPSAADTAAPSAGASFAPPTAGGATAPVATITPIAIDPGTDTGTAVNKTVQSIRSQVAGLLLALERPEQLRLDELDRRGHGAAGLRSRQHRAHDVG